MIPNYVSICHPSIYLSIFLSAGTGKTSQAVLEGLRLLQRGAVSRLLLTRPDFLVQGRDESGDPYPYPYP